MDAFYTKAAVARRCLASLLSGERAAALGLSRATRFLEPSAGAGAFVQPLLEWGYAVQAWDIAPGAGAPGDAVPGAGVRIERRDFLEGPLPDFDVAVGNPPFGFAARLAVRFFNRAAERATLIAFILPRTFRKVSIHDRLAACFHLVEDRELPVDSFLYRGVTHRVPTCWQVWQRRSTSRVRVPTPDMSQLLEFTTAARADFAMRRVGGRAGQILDGLEHSPSSTYFIRAIHHDVRSLLQRIDWDRVRNNTAGVRSISKWEIALALQREMQREVSSQDRSS